jgi:hypothetical protein
VIVGTLRRGVKREITTALMLTDNRPMLR